VIFPCRQRGKIVNLYGRSIGAAFALGVSANQLASAKSRHLPTKQTGSAFWAYELRAN
jgi:hypothetical protein